MFYMTGAARAPEIACDSCKQKLHHLNRPLHNFLLNKALVGYCVKFIFPEI